MRINVLFREETEVIKLQNKSVDDILNVSFGELTPLTGKSGTTDYNELEKIREQHELKEASTVDFINKVLAEAQNNK